MPKPEKIENVAELKEAFTQAKSFFVTDYQGLNVADISNLRKSLRESNVRFVVAKNTLFKLAAKEAGAPQLDVHFKGPTAVAFALKDPAAAAKILNDSFKDKQLPRIKAFVVDSQIHGAADIGRLADLPSKEVLLSMIVSAVEAPLSNLVSAVDAVFVDLVRTVDALAEKKKGAA
ncbi:MAG: 50S ribosomal protein L10 [Candidatus Zixiibacteriota bacterium]